jgi:hypothetical protein
MFLILDALFFFLQFFNEMGKIWIYLMPGAYIYNRNPDNIAATFYNCIDSLLE